MRGVVGAESSSAGVASDNDGSGMMPRLVRIRFYYSFKPILMSSVEVTKRRVFSFCLFPFFFLSSFWWL